MVLVWVYLSKSGTVQTYQVLYNIGYRSLYEVMHTLPGTVQCTRYYLDYHVLYTSWYCSLYQILNTVSGIEHCIRY